MKKYLCIDLKSFYASVECIERKLDPMTTNLVVADSERTEKTICLAVTPALKRFGVSGRARLFEVVAKVSEINILRRKSAPRNFFHGISYDSSELEKDSALRLSYIIARPRMALYLQYSARIYAIYLRYIAPQDIHIYSIDEVFIDITEYLKLYNLTAFELARKLISEVYSETGIIATVGIGDNMYLAKIAMDIMAKKINPRDGFYIAELDEMSYRQLLWNHRPLTDFWRIGRACAKKLEDHYLFTMGDIARCSCFTSGERMLYKLFGVNAELIIDHAWGWEPCEIKDIKNYKPKQKSLSSGQVLKCPYSNEDARVIIMEMAENLALDMVEKNLLTDQIVLWIGYDTENLKDPQKFAQYSGKINLDFYGRKVPEGARGSLKLTEYSNSSKEIIKAALGLFDRISNKGLTIRKLNISANNIIDYENYSKNRFEQISFFFSSYDEREKRIREATMKLSKRYGKNAVLYGYNLRECATGKERNEQIGGHKA